VSEIATGKHDGQLESQPLPKRVLDLLLSTGQSNFPVCTGSPDSSRNEGELSLLFRVLQANEDCQVPQKVASVISVLVIDAKVLVLDKKRGFSGSS
jgi:hypothetical protein